MGGLEPLDIDDSDDGADAAAAAGTEQAKGEAAKQLAVVMDNSTSDQQKHDDLADHRKLPQIARWRAVRAFSDDIDLKQTMTAQ